MGHFTVLPQLRALIKADKTSIVQWHSEPRRKEMTNLEPNPVVYTRREAAKIARMGLSSFDEALRRGEFLCVRVGRRVLIPCVAFERALSGQS